MPFMPTVIEQPEAFKAAVKPFVELSGTFFIHFNDELKCCYFYRTLPHTIIAVFASAGSNGTILMHSAWMKKAFVDITPETRRVMIHYIPSRNRLVITVMNQITTKFLFSVRETCSKYLPKIINEPYRCAVSMPVDTFKDIISTGRAADTCVFHKSSNEEIVFRFTSAQSYHNKHYPRSQAVHFTTTPDSSIINQRLDLMLLENLWYCFDKTAPITIEFYYKKMQIIQSSRLFFQLPIYPH